jgi:hypothetical protein
VYKCFITVNADASDEVNAGEGSYTVRRGKKDCAGYPADAQFTVCCQTAPIAHLVQVGWRKEG